MKTKKVLKRRIMIFGFSLVFILLCVFITYTFNGKNNNDLVLDKTNIQVIYENGEEGIKTSEYPLSITEGKSKSPNNIIKIKNKKEFNLKYQIVVSTDGDVNSLDVNKLYISVNDSEPKILGSYTDNIVYESTLLSKQDEEVNLKIWIGKDLVDSSDNGKSLVVNVNVIEKK